MTKLCSADGCTRRHSSRGFCAMHYKRLMKHGDANYAPKRTYAPVNRTHGCSRQSGQATPEYRAWSDMKKRCLSPSSHNYSRYGGRGITICDRWVHSFEAFLEDMGLRPSAAHSLDREDNDGPYDKKNCRWATKKEQNRNRACTPRLEFRGELISLPDLADRIGCSRAMLQDRLKRGWSVERAATTPRQSRGGAR